MDNKELWLISGSYPVVWVVPIWVWKVVGPSGQNSAAKRIAPAIELPDFIQTQVEAFLLEYIKKAGGDWYIRSRVLQTIARRKENHGPPGDYFVWGRRQMDENGQRLAGKSPQMIKMLQAIYAEGFLGNSQGEVDYRWAKLIHFFADWLLNKEKPVDLGFCRLHLSPYRPDWREQSAARMSHRLLGAKPGSKTLVLTIDIELTRRWTIMCRAVQIVRLQRLGPFEYAKEFMQFVHRRLPISRKLLVSHLIARKSYDVGVIVGDDKSSFRFVPIKKIGGNYPGCADFPDRLRRLFPDSRKSVVEKALAVEDAPLSPLPVVQSPPKDLWDGWPDLPESWDWTI